MQTVDMAVLLLLLLSDGMTMAYARGPRGQLVRRGWLYRVESVVSEQRRSFTNDELVNQQSSRRCFSTVASTILVAVDPRPVIIHY